MGRQLGATGNNDGLFAKYPSEGGVFTLKDGTKIPNPIRYQARTLVIWGRGNAAKVGAKIQGPWKPLLDGEDKAQMAVWVLDFYGDNVRPYKEVIVSFSVVSKDFTNPPTITNLWTLGELFKTQVGRPYAYKLWLNNQTMVNMGREVFGNNKHMNNEMTIDWGDDIHFDVKDNQASLLKGNLKLTDKNDIPSVTEWIVVNPPLKGDTTTEFKFVFETAPTYTPPNPGDIGDIETGGVLKELEFEATLYQHDTTLKAVPVRLENKTNVEEV